jgi:hypothetical protein
MVDLGRGAPDTEPLYEADNELEDLTDDNPPAR